MSERLALDDNRVDLERFASIVALGISHNQSILAGIGFLARLHEVIWIFVRPRCATSFVRIRLVKVVDVADGARSGVMVGLGLFSYETTS